MTSSPPTTDPPRHPSQKAKARAPTELRRATDTHRLLPRITLDLGLARIRGRTGQHRRRVGVGAEGGARTRRSGVRRRILGASIRQRFWMS